MSDEALSAVHTSMASTLQAFRSRFARDRAAVALYLAIALAQCFAVGALLAGLDIPMQGATYTLFYAVGLLSPFIAAAVVWHCRTGSFRPLLQMYLPLRLGRGAWIIVALPLAVAGAYLVAEQIGFPIQWAEADPWTHAAMGVLGWSAVMWAEETGWRGTLQPILQRHLHPAASSVLVGLAWSAWHVPLLLLLGMSALHFVLFTVQAIGISLAMAWAVNRSGTVLVAVLIHGAFNGVAGWLVTSAPTVPTNDLLVLQASGAIVLGLVVLLLTRGRLGLPAESRLVSLPRATFPEAHQSNRTQELA